MPIELLRDRLRHLELGVAVPAAARCAWSSSSPAIATMPTAVFYAADGGLHEQPRVRVRPRRGRRLRRRHRRPADALDEEHPRQLADRADHRRRRRPRASRYLDVVADLPARTCRRRAEAAAGARDRRARCSAGRCSSSTTIRRATPQAERGAAQRPRAQRRLSRGRVPVRADRRRLRLRAGGARRGEGAGRRHRRRHLRLLDRPGRARPRAARLDRKADILANHGVHIAGTDFDRRVELASILPLLGYGAFGPRIAGAAGARGAERGLLRPRDLAPDQHRLQPAAGRRAARHALLLRRSGAAPAPDDASSTERLGHDLLARAEAAKIAVADGGATTIELDRVEAGLAARASTRRGARDGARRRPRPDRRRRARDRRARPASAPATIDALYFTGGSTGLRLLTERLQRRFPRRGRCAATASPASPPGWRCMRAALRHGASDAGRR